MNNYLLQLLKEVKTLIIPGLGALTVTNESTGEILFMPYLKFDDGTLAKHIASKEGIEQNDASNMISKFVREVTAELDKGNSYDMYQFGRFVKVDGEIAFEVWSASNGGQQIAAEAPKQEPVIEKPVEPVKEEPKVEIKPAEEAPKPVEPKIEKIVPPVAETPKTEPKTEKTPPSVVEEPKVEASKVEKTVPPVVEPKKEPVKQEAKKEPAKKEKPVKAEKAPKEKRKTSVFSYILWGFLVLVLGAGTFIAIQFDSLKKDFPILADLAGENDDAAKGSEEIKQLEEDPDASTDSAESEPIPEDQVQIVEDQLPAEKPVEEPKKEEKAKPKETPKPKVEVTVNKKPVAKPKSQKTGSTASFDGSKHFHIIAGSFGSEANANRLAGKLQAKGFGEASVTMNGGMYRVSVKGFATLNEATAEAASIQSSVPGAWVLKM
ncbi:SPOR domain-containing protein [uncultured Fluviicola sp.]|uniref:SPOR domain-containing protein n=1 Tax=uncultured Fluviicola sp. TaxID=463303 RepID=UPI0025DD9746|nr:SPOR domain-containing protein [uncultured Fluviicola sp.]